jgi:AcrR family transcriptional regulator
MDTKSRILAAAQAVVEREGVSRLTLDAVAAEAGLSKGGLIYHFASKEALIEGMVARLIEHFEARIEAHRSGDAEPGAWTRGYLAAALPEPGTDADREAAGEAALVAALGNNPELLAPYRARQAAWAARQRDDGIDPETAFVVRLAADGLWLNEVFGVHPLPEPERASLVARLERMTRGE